MLFTRAVSCMSVARAVERCLSVRPSVRLSVCPPFGIISIIKTV